MDALDVISLDEAKAELNITWPLDSGDVKILTRCIKTAVAWVETYTDYALYQRTAVVNANRCCNKIVTFPINSLSVTDKDGHPVTAFHLCHGTLHTTVCTQEGNVVTLSIGYTDPTDVPSPLISACMKLITYLYENRDAFPTELPIDIQLLINQYRRSPAFA